MGTHPIFESDFDCLTVEMEDGYKSAKFVRDLTSSDDDDEVVERRKEPEKKEKKLKREKKEKKQKKEKTKKDEKEQPEQPQTPKKVPPITLAKKLVSPKKREIKSTKRALSPPSEASDLDEDLAPPPQKTSKKPAARSGGGFDENEDKGLDIGHNRFVKVKNFKGSQYLDIREYFETAKGFMPGKKGVTMKKSQWQAFRDAFFDLDEKVANAGREDEEPMDLGGNKRIAISKFKMKWLLIDIREMYDKDGEQRPGKGIALKPENYNKIKQYQNEIDEMW